MMEIIFEVGFHIISAIFRFILVNIVLEIIVEIVVRATGYGIVYCYRFGQNVDIDSFEVILMGFLFWLGLIPFSLYIFLFK
ncbi:hypothetical protein QSV37_16845 [Acinetobacter sp. VNK23]|uniref:hypothetical protein n=1 Tax=Acinetobacter thutiue TaxID=2998078 RepID=UPI002577CF96|nr:hypothetical protein [Acinetobacter thutiue]MDM1021944.1 hypothetical protein [Acinetobacter thutiue]